MILTTRSGYAIAATLTLSMISTAALCGAHSRSHSKSHSKGHPVSSLHKPSVTSTAALSAVVIDRAVHGRDSFDRSGSTNRIERGENIVRTALAYRGTPYRFGGRSARSGFDCSGFVQAACGKWGLYLPRVAGAQFTKGKAVKPWNMEPGDLVFFQGTYKRGLSHVGIFIGEGQFVHAAGAGKGVKISSLSEAYYQKHWAGARRFDLKQLPKAAAEMPVIASEIIVDRPSRAVQPGGRMIVESGLPAAETSAAVDSEATDTASVVSTPRVR